MQSLGLDIIEIERVRRAALNPRFVRRVFTDEELKMMGRHPRRVAEEMAGKFAAKEAVIKVVGRKTFWKEIEVLNDHFGKPRVVLHGRMAQLAQGRGVVVSITHSKDFAAAVAMWGTTGDGEA
jgi:phosphopantetheine--protein transferase-like protein